MKNKIDNFDLIRPLLNWEKPGDFYYIQLLKRKKDGTTKYSNKNNSSRLVNKYLIYSLEHFDEKVKEIKIICDELKCRAGIHLNKLEDKIVAKETLKRIVECYTSENYHIMGVIESICGAHNFSKERKVFIDIDTKDEETLQRTINFINGLQPFDKPDKVIATLPTYSGYHLVTENFRQDYFQKFCETEQYVNYITKFCDDEEEVSSVGNLVALYYPSQNEP